MISVEEGHVDELVEVAIDLAGLVLILDAAATGDPTPAAVERILGRAHALPLQQEVREEMFDDLATPTGLTEQKSTFTRRDVIQAVCERMPTATDISVRGIEQVAGLFLSSRRAVPLAARDAVPQRTDVIRRQDGRVVAAVRDEQRVGDLRAFDLVRQLGIAGNQVLDLAHGMQHRGVITAAETPSDLG